MKPEQFAAILIKKLESLKRSQEVQEKLAHKLFEVCIYLLYDDIFKIKLKFY